MRSSARLPIWHPLTLIMAANGTTGVSGLPRDMAGMAPNSGVMTAILLMVAGVEAALMVVVAGSTMGSAISMVVVIFGGVVRTVGSGDCTICTGGGRWKTGAILLRTAGLTTSPSSISFTATRLRLPLLQHI